MDTEKRREELYELFNVYTKVPNCDPPFSVPGRGPDDRDDVSIRDSASAKEVTRKYLTHTWGTR